MSDTADGNEVELLLSELGDDVESVIASLAEKPALVRRLFVGTYRDRTQDLSEDAAFDLAYAGNWGEWLAALKEIVVANGLIPFLDSLSS